MHTHPKHYFLCPQPMPVCPVPSQPAHVYKQPSTATAEGGTWRSSPYVVDAREACAVCEEGSSHGSGTQREVNRNSDCQTKKELKTVYCSCHSEAGGIEKTRLRTTYTSK